MVFLLALFLVISVLAKRLAGKSVSDMTYIVSSGMLNVILVFVCLCVKDFYKDMLVPRSWTCSLTGSSNVTAAMPPPSSSLPLVHTEL